MPNETLIRVAKKVADEGAIAVGPFRVGVPYAAPPDALAVLGDKFEATTLGKDDKGVVEVAVPLSGVHLQHLDDLRAKKKADEAAKAAAAKAEADAKAAAVAPPPVLDKSAVGA